mgnify:CR=1 FL=1
MINAALIYHSKKQELTGCTRVLKNYSIKLFIIIVSVALLCSFAHIALAQKNSLTIKIETDNKSPILQQLNELAKEMEQTAKIYKTTNQKAYWENEGRKSFDKLLRSQGYYAGTIDVEFPVEEPNTIIFYINSLQRYKLNKVTMTHSENSNREIILPSLSYFKLKNNNFAIAKNIIEAQEKILRYIENNNCLLSLAVQHAAIINHLENTVEIDFIINAGASATIEKIEFTGLKKVNEAYAKKLIKLKNAQCFRNSYVAEARGRLQKSGLFASTTPTIPMKTNTDGTVPITFNLTERKQRSLKAGVSYGTDLGYGATLGWENRNFFGSGEKVQAELFGNQKEQVLQLDYTEPFYRRDDQTLKLSAKAEKRISKAFDSKEGSLSGFLERELSEYWTTGFGLKFSQAKIKDKAKNQKRNQEFSLLSTPLFITHDTRKNILDPRNGHELTLEGTPFFSLNSKTKPFFKGQISGSTYFPFKSKHQPVLAVRGAFGSILGIKTLKVPHTERFYVGGSSSLRGYAYQLVGELDKNKKPLGGRSFIETTIELRTQITEDIGIVGFVDSGMAYRSILPTNKPKLLHGIGFGLRYITSFGPLRADIGFPIRKRKSVDDAFQLYFGIGQSF